MDENYLAEQYYINLTRKVYNGIGTDPNSTDDICNAIRAKFDALQQRISYLTKENERIKDEAYAQNELAEMREAYNKMKVDYLRGFPLSQDEMSEVLTWQERHTETVHKAKTIQDKLKLEGVSGGRWIYEFVPTSLGTGGKCICASCRAKAQMEAGDPNQYESRWKYLSRIRDLEKEYDASFEFQEI